VAGLPFFFGVCLKKTVNPIQTLQSKTLSPVSLSLFLSLSLSFSLSVSLSLSFPSKYKGGGWVGVITEFDALQLLGFFIFFFLLLHFTNNSAVSATSYRGIAGRFSDASSKASCGSEFSWQKRHLACGGGSLPGSRWTGHCWPC